MQTLYQFLKINITSIYKLDLYGETPNWYAFFSSSKLEIKSSEIKSVQYLTGRFWFIPRPILQRVWHLFRRIPEIKVLEYSFAESWNIQRQFVRKQKQFVFGVSPHKFRTFKQTASCSTETGPVLVHIDLKPIGRLNKIDGPQTVLQK